MTPNALTQYILRAGVIKQHKLNQILSWYDVIFLLLGGFLPEKDHRAQYIVTHTLRVLFYKAHENFP